MMPVLRAIMRTLKSDGPATYTLPDASTARLVGWFRKALVATPPSPENPAVPLPAYVMIVPWIKNNKRELTWQKVGRTEGQKFADVQQGKWASPSLPT